MAEETEIEEVLDQDYLFLISFAKTYYPYVVGERDRALCNQWLLKLCSENVGGISAKRNRNTYLAHFLMHMQNFKMTGPFSKPPEDGPLPESKTIFASPHVDNYGFSEEQQQFSEEAEPQDFQERSADGRTYVAIRCMPNNQGTYAFVALNLDKEDDDSKDGIIIPCATDMTKLRHFGALQKLSKCGNPSKSQMEDFYMRNIEAKASGDISHLYKTLSSNLGEACGRNASEIAYYEVLLNQIDEEIKGAVSGDNELVRFLVCRLAKDLKKLPKMKHLFDLSREQRNLKLLEILRQKLVVRQQEQKRRNLLTEMEEKMTCFGNRSECCMERDDEPTDSMWQLAVTRPLSESYLRRLAQVYPENSIATFLDLLADDRLVIFKRGQVRQIKAIESMRLEVYREVQCGKTEYNKARAIYRDWNQVLSIVEEMMYEATINRDADQENDQQDEKCQDEHLLTSMIASIQETKNLVMEEARRGEELTEKIANANTWSFETRHDEGQDSSWEIKSIIECTRQEIESLRCLVKNQQKRIATLRDKLEYE